MNNLEPTMSRQAREMFHNILDALDTEIKTAEFEFMQDVYQFRRNIHGVWLYKNPVYGSWELFS